MFIEDTFGQAELADIKVGGHAFGTLCCFVGLWSCFPRHMLALTFLVVVLRADVVVDDDDFDDD